MTVQEVVEEAVGSLVGERLQVVGASRTDAGVHARGQAAHLEGADGLPDRALIHGINHHLPEDVRILAAVRVAEGFHARKHARSKLYSYRLVRGEVLSPIDQPFAVRVDSSVDVEAMNVACENLIGEHDFTAFALAGGSHKSPVRRLLSARCEEDGADVWFRVSGDGFLRGMVRSLVGTLMEVGVGRRSPESLADLLQGAPRSAAGPTAPARGLTLEDVDFDSRWVVRVASSTVPSMVN
jgi:tRNA pseudouridine38-40 synthase